MPVSLRPVQIQSETAQELTQTNWIFTPASRRSMIQGTRMLQNGISSVFSLDLNAQTSALLTWRCRVEHDRC